MFVVAVGAAYYYKTKKKDKGTMVVPAAKPDKAPGQPVRQPATQPATQPAAASATAGAGPAAPYSQLTPEAVKALYSKLTPETVKAIRDAKEAWTRARSEAPTQHQTMTITIPPGAGPGTTLRVMTPSRQPMDIVVPPGAGPGTQLQVPVPVGRDRS